MPLYLLIKLKSKLSGLGSRNIDSSCGRLAVVGLLVVAAAVAGRWGSNKIIRNH